jgi:DNA-binding transcriptional LysR family regulator
LLEELSRHSHVTRNLGAGGEVATVKASATEPVIAEILAPHLVRLLSVKPALRVDLRVEKQLASVSLGNTDIAVRLVAPTDDNLLAYKLASVNFRLYASPDYVASLAPITAAWTEQIDVLTYDAHGAINELAWLQRVCLSHRVVASTSKTRGLLEAAAGGAGVALLPEYLAPKKEGSLSFHRQSGCRCSSERFGLSGIGACRVTL